jgi:uncharacterized protein
MTGLRTAAAAAFLLAGAAPPVSGQAALEGSFVIRMGADTFAVESFGRSADRLEGEIAGRAIGRIAYRLSLGPAATTPELTLRAWRPGAAGDEAAFQDARVALRGDSAIVDATTPAGTQTQRLGTREGAFLYVNPSMAMMEQMVLRARALGGDRVELPVFIVQGGLTVPATVTRLSADSVVVAIAGMEMRAAVAGDGRLLGGAIPAQNLSFSRVEGRLAYAPAIDPPDYSAPEGAPYTAEEVEVATEAGHTLAGTLTRPAGTHPVPAVVMITGSGPQERDQALPTILPGYRPFRDLADTLSRRGIAVLRLDDRGTGASGGDFASATSADFADDVRAALTYLRGRGDVDGARLGLVGHSEGGLIAPLVAADDPALAAVVAIAGPSRTGREIIHFQQRQAIEGSPALAALDRDSLVAAARDELEAVAARQPWLGFFLDHDPLPVARRVRTPVLVLHGETDRQVPAEQAHELAAAFREGGNPDVTVRVLPDVNHLLVRDPDGSFSGYASLTERTVAPEVRGALADWLAERLLR